jgi:hypothetical protein
MLNGGSKAVRHKTHGTTNAPKVSHQSMGHRSPGAFRREFQRPYPVAESERLQGQIDSTLASYAAFGLENHPTCEAELAPLREALEAARESEKWDSVSYFPEDSFPCL